MWSKLSRLRSNRRPTLQFRVTASVVAIFIVTLVVFTAIDLASERRAFLRSESRHAVTTLAQLAAMAEALPARGAIARHVVSLNSELLAVGGQVDVLPLRTAGNRPAVVVASRRLLLDGQPFEMRYRLREGTMRKAALGAIGLHLLHGLIAVAAIIAATELLVRKRLVQPLALITHQLAHMRKGGGWIASLPVVDPELTQITEAITDLGPGLEEQVREWVATERRAGVALTLLRIEHETREPLHHAQSLVRALESLQVSADEQEGIRSLRADIERISTVINDGHLWAAGSVNARDGNKELAR